MGSQKRQFFGPRLVLKMILSTQRIVLAIKLLIISQLQRVTTFYLSILGTLVSLVGMKPPLNVISKATI